MDHEDLKEDQEEMDHQGQKAKLVCQVIEVTKESKVYQDLARKEMKEAKDHWEEQETKAKKDSEVCFETFDSFTTEVPAI